MTLDDEIGQSSHRYCAALFSAWGWMRRSAFLHIDSKSSLRYRDNCAPARHAQRRRDGMADVKARVVSMLSCELFEQQSESYRNSALPDDVKARMSVEQADFFSWV